MTTMEANAEEPRPAARNRASPTGTARKSRELHIAYSLYQQEAVVVLFPFTCYCTFVFRSSVFYQLCSISSKGRLEQHGRGLASN